MKTSLPLLQRRKGTDKIYLLREKKNARLTWEPYFDAQLLNDFI